MESGLVEFWMGPRIKMAVDEERRGIKRNGCEGMSVVFVRYVHVRFHEGRIKIDTRRRAKQTTYPTTLHMRLIRPSPIHPYLLRLSVSLLATLPSRFVHLDDLIPNVSSP